jgi:hippurate hydrolase
MGAEDFGLFGKDGVPTFMFRLGTIPPEKVAAAKAKGESLPSLHSALYFPDAPPSLRTGVRAMTSAVVGLLPPSTEKAER